MNFYDRVQVWTNEAYVLLPVACRRKYGREDLLSFCCQDVAIRSRNRQAQPREVVYKERNGSHTVRGYLGTVSVAATFFNIILVLNEIRTHSSFFESFATFFR